MYLSVSSIMKVWRRLQVRNHEKPKYKAIRSCGVGHDYRAIFQRLARLQADFQKDWVSRTRVLLENPQQMSDDTYKTARQAAKAGINYSSLEARADNSVKVLIKSTLKNESSWLKA